MLHYALLACLCLLVRADSEDDILPFPYRTLHHELVHPKLRNYLISPDTFRGRETFVVAQYEANTKRSPPELEVKLTLINDRRGKESKHCDLTLKGKMNSRKLDLISLRRVSETNVTLVLSLHGRNEVFPTSELIFYDMKNCHVKSRLDASKNLIVVPTGENKFNVFIYDLKMCHGKPTCWWSYDVSRGSFSKIHRFTTTHRMSWSTLRVEVLSNGYLKVHGSTMDGDRYMVFLLNPETEDINYTMEIPYENKKVDIVSTGMSFCWVHPDHKKAVHCKQTDDYGKDIFEKKIHFEEPRKLIDVRATREGEIFLLTNNADCEGADCWDMYATRISEKSGKVERILLPFQCSGDDQTKLTVFGTKNIVEYSDRTDFYYGCKWENKFNFNTYFLYRSSN